MSLDSAPTPRAGRVGSPVVDLGIAGRRALVTASSAGLGRATAVALAEAGCRVAVNGRDAGRVAETVADLDGAVAVVGDVGTAEGATRVVDAAVDALGGLDVLVINAGGPPTGDAGTTEVAAYTTTLEAVVIAPVAMCAAVVPAMRERGWGRVVAITSISVRQPIPGLVLSNTARPGLTGYLKTLAAEVAADGVTVNTVQPGTHDTDRIRQVWGDDLSALAARQPTGGVGDAADFGRVVAFVCSESARFVTGASIPVDGGSFLGLQ